MAFAGLEDCWLHVFKGIRSVTENTVIRPVGSAEYFVENKLTANNESQK
jgi:hypothetical protein